MDVAEITQRLLPCVTGGGCTAWIGSGLSDTREYKPWPDAVAQLCSACGVEEPASATPSPGLLIETAQQCKDADEEIYRITLADIYGHECLTTREALHRLLRLPFEGYITTNFDPLLHEACRTHGKPEPAAYPDLVPREFFRGNGQVFHIHGLAVRNGKPDASQIVFARSEYDEAYGREGCVRAFLEGVLQQTPVLFLGCRLGDPDLQLVLRRVKEWEARTGRARPERYVLMAEPQPRILAPNVSNEDARAAAKEISEDTRRLYRDLGITVLSYSRHKDVDDVLWGLLEGIRKMERDEAAFAAAETKGAF